MKPREWRALHYPKMGPKTALMALECQEGANELEDPPERIFHLAHVVEELAQATRIAVELDREIHKWANMDATLNGDGQSGELARYVLKTLEDVWTRALDTRGKDGPT